MSKESILCITQMRSRDKGLCVGYVGFGLEQLEDMSEEEPLHIL
jgi:hypothetical protein